MAAQTSLPSAVRADKALVRQVAEFDEQLEIAADFHDLMKDASAKAPIQKDMAALRKRIAVVMEGIDRREMAKAIAVLVKDAAKLADRASEAARMEMFQAYRAMWSKASGRLAQALVEVGAIEPVALRMPVQKEQGALKGELDRIEKSIDYTANIEALRELTPRIDALLKRVQGLAGSSDWMRSTHAPLLARVQAALKRITAERCRKSLLAELDFLEADTHKALGSGDLKPVQARVVPQLQRIEKLAARIVAVSPTLDRELARLTKLAGVLGDAALTVRLKALIQAKATAWPAGVDADGIDAALTAFEAEVATLARQIEKAGMARPTTKA
jgi:hypothetical protein